MKNTSNLPSLLQYMSRYVATLLILLTPVSLFAAAADSDIIEGAQDTKALAFMSYTDGSFSSDPIGNCTGYFVKASKDNEANNIRFVTARHCLGFSNSWKIYPNGPTVKKNDKMNPGGVKFDRYFNKKNTVIDGIDHFYSALDKTEGISYFNLATEVPQVHSKLKIMGYPDGVGPKEFSCVLKGYLMRPKQLKGDVEEGVQGYLYCPGATVVPGISGGPVLNEKGEVVATMSARASNVIAFVSPNYLVGKQTLKMYKFEKKTIVEDADQTLCFGADHRLLALDKCNSAFVPGQEM